MIYNTRYKSSYTSTEQRDQKIDHYTNLTVGGVTSGTYPTRPPCRSRRPTRAEAPPPGLNSTTPVADLYGRIRGIHPSGRALTLSQDDRRRASAQGPEPAVLTQRIRRQAESTRQAPDLTLIFLTLEGGHIGYGIDHSPVPTPARAFDNSPNGSPGGTPVNEVTSSPEPGGLARGRAATTSGHRSPHSFPDPDTSPITKSLLRSNTDRTRPRRLIVRHH
ncbi:hypothetical protein BHE74_00008551 [Ensete ventricosum]|nr:hypothetical protein BHE74_00008551 [Ensete ventricosum]